MKNSRTTYVLSFPQIAVGSTQIAKPKIFANQFLGDIVVSLPQAKKQAIEQKIKLEREVLFLIFHSILHLVGHDHVTNTERLKMQKWESFLWKSLVV